MFSHTTETHSVADEPDYTISELEEISTKRRVFVHTFWSCADVIFVCFKIMYSLKFRHHYYQTLQHNLKLV